MEMVLYVQDSSDSSTKAAAFPGALSEESKVNSAAGDGKVKKWSSRCAVVCLCLLVLLLFIGILFGLNYFYNSSTMREKEMIQLQTSYTHAIVEKYHLQNNLTKQMGQSQTSYTSLQQERDQLQTSYTSLQQEKDQLQASCTSLQQERDQLQTSYTGLQQEKDQLQTSYTSLQQEKDQLQIGYTSLQQERDQLQTSYTGLQQEKDQLQTSYTSLQQEKDQLQIGYTSLQQERDQLQIGYTSLQQERDQLQTSNKVLIGERQQVQVNWTRQTSQLQTSYSQLLQEQQQLHQKLQEAEQKLQDSAASLKNLSEERTSLRNLLGNGGWHYFNGSLYQVSSTKKSWNGSRSDCLQKGADLLVINSKEEQAFANRFKKYVWIGLTDVASEGLWTWVDGTNMSASYWSSGEPNGKKDENCGDIKNYSTEKSWNDESCSISLFWICEKKLFP